jgi:hypothetical protein
MTRLAITGVLGICAAFTVAAIVGATGSGERFAVPHTRQGAEREAQIVLDSVVLPPKADRLDGEPRGDAGVLRLSGPSEVAEDLVDRHAWWRVPVGWRSVLAFVHDHPPQGSREFTSGSGEIYGRETSASITFGWPVSPGEIRTRQLSVLVATRPGHTTYLRVDARAAWLLLRPAAERVPEGVHEIAIEQSRPRHAPSLSLTVTDMSKVDAIVAAVNRLPILQPGIAISCPEEGIDEPWISFVFRETAGGPVLAEASERADSREPTTACNPMSFSIRGVPQTPLLEGPRVVVESERLLGTKL